MGTDPYGHLEPGGFPGKIHFVDTEAKALRASLALRRTRTVGLDTESRPSFRKGEIFPISLVQIATREHAFVFQVRPGAPYRSLKRLIEDPSVRKIVQGATEESREIRRDLGIEPRGFVDLPTVARAAGYTELNLRALTAATLGIRISKSMQRSDWSRPSLSRPQIEYAATDAWACLAVYEKIQSGAGPIGPEKGGLLIRAASGRDADAIVALIQELAATIHEKSPLGASGVHEYLRSPSCFVLLAELGGRVAGLASYSVRPNLYHARDCCLIEELVVSARARRTGIGRALLEAAIGDAEKRGCAEISVTTSAGNRGARALYRSVGLTDEALLLERHFG
jgi:ribonuclease D